MRFYYVVLAVVATLLASTNAVSADAQQSQISQTTPEIVAAAQTYSAVKRSLRAQKPAYEEEDSLDSLDYTEERGGGIHINDLKKIISSKLIAIPTNIANMETKALKKMLDKFASQGLSQKKFATKLGLKDVDDVNHVNSKFFNEWKHLFRAGKKPKKVPEGLIGNHEYYY
ncbi:hypothetical protein PHYPSEUDO_007574 [Phytophthora pseudosyringae]|uniref:RxLR effector protein n=1 Tax=Phytophthora pseudosyringae TaxID=221518 RepID=A0A8T1VLJ8_9STRA|nr:hypothetical protein PHYPSEUDO_007574 [Phytophthora pseudosyringae]